MVLGFVILGFRILMFQCAAEQQQGESKHHREAFDDEIEMPPFQPVNLLLSIPALVCGRTSAIPKIPVETVNVNISADLPTTRV